MTRLDEIRADDASYEDDDDVRALRAIGGTEASRVVADRRWLLARVDKLVAALRASPPQTAKIEALQQAALAALNEPGAQP